VDTGYLPGPTSNSRTRRCSFPESRRGARLGNTSVGVDVWVPAESAASLGWVADVGPVDVCVISMLLRVGSDTLQVYSGVRLNHEHLSVVV
jgi:hypothetical protein